MAPEPMNVIQIPSPAVTDRTVKELEDELASLGVPRFRARQLFRAIHHRHVQDWDQMTDLPAGLRGQLASRYRLLSLDLQLRQRSEDGTEKLLLTAWDRQEVETVYIPAVPAEERRRGASSPTPIEHARRLTVCVSSQAGCALACQFCATGQMGFARNLTSGEIVEQVYRAEEPDRPRRVDNVVFMGMGEPLANYDQVVRAIRLLADPLGYGFSPRRVTVSTSGLVPEMYRLADEGFEVRLAVSLHAPDDALRSRLMPINRRYPLLEVLKAATHYAERSGRRVSYEYVMLHQVNDSDARAEQLARLLHERDAHVNLIPYNQTASGFASSPPERIRAFARLLRARGVPCTVRASRGQDIAAACGQLKAENQRIVAAQAGRAVSLTGA